MTEASPTSAYQSPELDEIRKRIDTLDNHVHDLLMERADLVMRISEEKKKHGIQIVQPAREARMMRRLMERHRGPLPEETIVRIWRELVGSISLLQTGLSVAVYSPPHELDYWDIARDYFGTVLPMRKTVHITDALNLVVSKEVDFAVVPWPHKQDAYPWWARLFDNRDLRIIQKLPFGDKENFNYGEHPALVVSLTGFDTSGDDHSFIGLQFNRETPLSRSDVEGLNAIERFRSADKTFHLLEIDTYIANDEEAAPYFEKLRPAKIMCLGGFPSPLAYKKIV